MTFAQLQPTGALAWSCGSAGCRGGDPPRAAGDGEGGPAACAGHPSRLQCRDYAVILTLILVFSGISFTQLLHWSHREAARLTLGPCRASPG